MPEGLTYSIADVDSMTSAEIYGQVLCQLGEQREDIVALTADLGTSTKIGKFGERFPHRFFNMGIAEQNMFGTAAGLALAGLTPFVSTFAVFTSMRAGEQVRTDICYQNLRCRIIATHGGLSFGQAGTTHHCTEDIAILRSMANMTVIVPADGIETAESVKASVDHPGPVYIRIGRSFEPLLYEDGRHPGFEIGKAIELRPGNDITVICCGVTALQAYDASRMLEHDDGLGVRVLNVHTIKPIDREAILRAALDTRRIVTVEEHNVIGGLGSAVAEVIIESGKACAFRKIGLQDIYAMVGIPEDLYSHYGMDADGIAATVRDVMGMDFEEDEDWEDDL